MPRNRDRYPDRDDIIYGIVDHILDTPQAQEVVRGFTGLFDRIGNSIDSALRPSVSPRPRARTRPTAAAPPPPKDPTKEAYKILGLSPEASFEEIKKAYRRLMRKHHPDRQKDPAAQKAATATAAKINEAYQHLEQLHKLP
jgi:DnaJ-domain-containing protein 1